MPALLTLSTSPFVLDLALRLASPSQHREVVDDKLCDEDIVVSDDDGLTTDVSTDNSPVSSPVSIKCLSVPSSMDLAKSLSLMADDGDSPPKRPLRRKRKRMSEEERKVRHREVQRQFMKRKRARIAELRKVQAKVMKQLRLVTVLSEIEQLKKENEQLQEQYDACEQGNVEANDAAEERAPLPKTFGDLVFSVPSQDTEMNDDPMATTSDELVDGETIGPLLADDMTDFEWSEILDILSGDGTVEFELASDLSTDS